MGGIFARRERVSIGLCWMAGGFMGGPRRLFPFRQFLRIIYWQSTRVGIILYGNNLLLGGTNNNNNEHATYNIRFVFHTTHVELNYIMRLQSAALENVERGGRCAIKFAQRNAYKCIMIIMCTNSFSFIINARDTMTTTRRKYTYKGLYGGTRKPLRINRLINM